MENVSMFSLVSSLPQTASNLTHCIAEQTIDASLSLLSIAEKVSESAQVLLCSEEFWTIGQGAMMTVSGLVTMARFSRSQLSRKWRYPVIALGACYVGFGICTTFGAIGRLWSGASFPSLSKNIPD